MKLRFAFGFVALTLLVLTRANWLCAEDTPAAPKVGEAARDFALDDLSGKSVKLSELTKKGPVVLVVLRGWPGYQCPICTRQVADFRAHLDDLKASGASVVMVYPGPVDGLKDHAEEFFKDKGVAETFHLLIDPDFKFTNGYALRWNAEHETAYPSTFIIDSKGIIRFAKTSKTHGDRAEAAEVLKALTGLK